MPSLKTETDSGIQKLLTIIKRAVTRSSSWQWSNRPTSRTISGAEQNGVLFGVCSRTDGPNRWPSVRLLPNSDSVRRSVGLPPAATVVRGALGCCRRRCMRKPHGTPNRIAVRQQTNNWPSVGHLVRATKPEQNSIPFGTAFRPSREGPVHMRGSCDGNGFHRLITARTLGNRSFEVPSVTVAGDLTTQQRTGVAVETPTVPGTSTLRVCRTCGARPKAKHAPALC